MSFLAPMWLLGLLPWGALTVWLLRGRWKKVEVPFLELWKGERARRPKRSLERPPVALMAAILAILLALLAASRPAVRVPSGGVGLTIVVDRGITMSARPGDEFRFAEAARLARQPLIDAFGNAAVGLRFVPTLEPRRTGAFDWPGIVRAVPPTAVDTTQLLATAVSQALRESEGPVVVLSDQPLTIENRRLVQVVPEKQVTNVGIVRFAVRETPARQAMVRVRNESLLDRVVLRVVSEGREEVRVEAALPASGERDYFLDVPAIGGEVLAELEVNDDFAPDNRAWLVRERAWPRIEPRSALPAEVQRMIETYADSRPPTRDSRRIAVATSAEAAAANDPAAIVAGTGSGAPSNAAVQVTSHPVTGAVRNWPTVAPAEAPEGPGWTSLVRRGEDALLAIRTEPVRQVWLGVRSAEWAATADFVILWTNIFDWLGEGGDLFAAHPVAAIGPEWTTSPAAAEPGLSPGLYRRSDGALRAVNAIDVRFPRPVADDWRSALKNAADATEPAQGKISLAPALLLLALAALVVSAIAWGRRPASSSLTRFSAARTL